jgi:uncharacterized MAPEG superfamily protein
MENEQFYELCWLTRIAAVTALMWVPYVLDRFMKEGIFGSLKNPQGFKSTPSAWAIRAKAAHLNAVENLPIIGVLAIVAFLTIPGNSVVGTSVVVYLVSRIIHYISYTLGIAGVRTLSFLAGFGAQLVIIFQIASHLN